MESEEEENYFEKFNMLIKHGKGLYITQDGDTLDDIRNASVVLMMEQWQPKSLEKLKEEISNFFEMNIITLITNIEYLLEENSFMEVRNFLEWLYKKVSLNKGTLILSADLKSVEKTKKNELQDLISDIHLGMISDSISNYLRRQIILLLCKREKYSFTKIAHVLDIKDNPKLSFHLKKLKDDGVIEQDSEKRYFLSKVGEEIAHILKDIKGQKINKKENLLWMPTK
jgi:hypothetical protein